MTMNRRLSLAALALCALATTACGRPFDVKTAPGFIELDDQAPSYDYRAMSPEGVVMGVRAIDVDDKGDLAFWARAITLRFRQANGYALVDTKDVESRDKTPGKELDFGHDESGKPFTYRVRLFRAQSRLFIAEAGGTKEQMERYKDTVDWMLSSVRVKCGSFLYPELASHTCNKW
jgi:hypothetical protein